MMFRIQNILFVALVFLCSTHLFPQSKFSSVEIEKNDTVKVNFYQTRSNDLFKIGKYDSAKIYGYKALEISEKIKYKIGTINSYNIIAKLYIKNGEYYDAIKTYKKNIEFAKQINYEKGLATIYNNLGTVYQNQSNYPEALNMFFESLKIFEKANNLKGMSVNYNNIGNIFRIQNKSEDAINYYNKSVEIKKQLGDIAGLASTYNNIGIVYFNDKNFDKALEFHNSALKIREESSNIQGVSMSLQNIGTIYFSKNMYEKANEYFLKSLKIKDEISDKAGMVALYKSLGRLKYDNKEFDEARNYLEKAIKLGHELEMKKELYESYRYLATLDSVKGNYKSALSNLVAAIGFKDSIYNKENNIKLFQSQLNYEIEKKETMAFVEREKQKYILSKSQHDILLLQQQNKFNELDIQKKIVEIRRKDMLNDNQQKNIALLNKERIIKMEQAKQSMLQLKQQRLVTYFISTICLLFVILLLFAINAFMAKNKKNKIILSQKEKVEEQNELIELQKSQVEAKNREMLDSILYAKRLQDAIFPSSQYLNKILKQGFVFYQPKDIVSGDFYWAQENNKNIFFAVADCTGHGVPGALVSVVCSNAIKRAINEFHISEPGKILDKVRELVVDTFDKGDEDVKDGMDISLCNLEKLSAEKLKLQWAGANNPLWIVRSVSIQNDEIKNNIEIENNTPTSKIQISNYNDYNLIEIKANIQAICKEENPIPFTTHSVILEKGDTLYLFSDGFADQFGGKKGKKFKLHNFKELIISIQNFDMHTQKQMIKNTFETWKGNLEQVDDICIIAVKI